MPRGIYKHKKGYKRKPFTKEHRNNLSKSIAKGYRNMTKKQRAKLGKCLLGRKHTKEELRKMKKNRDDSHRPKWTKERRKKMEKMWKKGKPIIEAIQRARLKERKKILKERKLERDRIKKKKNKKINMTKIKKKKIKRKLLSPEERRDRERIRKREAKKRLKLKIEESLKKLQAERNVVIIRDKKPVNLVREYLAKKANN